MTSPAGARPFRRVPFLVRRGLRGVAPALAALAGCRAAPPVVHPHPSEARDAAVAPPATPAEAAVLALARSPRIDAARRQFDAELARRRAIALPPDLRIEVMTGIPLMEMGETPLRVSIGASLAWLLNRRALERAADARIDAAAGLLAAAACEVASEGREAFRTVAARAAAVEAARESRDAFERSVAAVAAARAAGEATGAALATAEASLDAARRDEALARGALASAQAWLDSLVGFDATTLGAIDGDAATERLVHLVDGSEDVAERLATRAEATAAADVALATRTLASLEPALGSTFDGSVGFDRDMEGDEGAMFGVGITIPSGRLPQEIAAARSALRAAEAMLAESTRMADLDSTAARIELRAAAAAFGHAVGAVEARRRERDADAARAAAGELDDASLAATDARLARARREAADAALAWCAARGRLERLHPLRGDGAATAAIEGMVRR